MTDAELRQVAWYSPGHYPSRCTPELALDIAVEVAQGASLIQAAGKYGCAHRIKAWYKQGYDAAMRDAEWSDQHAAQLDLFLKVNQAYGMAGSTAQKRLFKIDPGWWLTHNPEARAEAQTGSVMAQLEAPDTVETTARTVPVVPMDAPSVRERIRMVLEAGGGVSQSRSKVVDADVHVEGTGTDG